MSGYFASLVEKEELGSVTQRSQISRFSLLKRGAVFVTCAILSGCVTQTGSFSVPEKLTFQNNVFEKTTHTQLDEMQQLLYLPSGTEKNPDNWQQGVLIFLDKNSKNRSLNERAELRRATFAKQPDTLAYIDLLGDELRSEVIYPPTERFQDVQLEVSRGRNLECGFGQMQFADKRSVSTKNVQNIQQYQPLVATLAQQFAQLAWQIGCK